MNLDDALLNALGEVSLYEDGFRKLDERGKGLHGLVGAHLEFEYFEELEEIAEESLSYSEIWLLLPFNRAYTLRLSFVAYENALYLENYWINTTADLHRFKKPEMISLVLGKDALAWPLDLRLLSAEEKGAILEIANKDKDLDVLANCGDKESESNILFGPLSRYTGRISVYFPSKNIIALLDCVDFSKTAQGTAMIQVGGLGLFSDRSRLYFLGADRCNSDLASKREALGYSSEYLLKLVRKRFVK